MLVILKSKKGEGYLDTIVIVIAALLVIALALKVFPVFVAKSQLNTFANECLRTAELSGRIGSEVNGRIDELNETTNLNPIVIWNGNYIPGTSKIQLGNDISVTVTIDLDIGFFTFGSFPIELTSKATGKSEVYWK